MDIPAQDIQQTKKSSKDIPLDDSAVSALELAFQDEIIDEGHDNNSTTPFKKIAWSIVLIFLVLFISVSAIFIYYYFENTKNTDKIIKIDEHSTAFNPVLDASNGKVYSGKIFESVIQDDTKFKHELLDVKGNLVVYVYSDTIDLDIAKGLQVSVKGIPDFDNYNGTLVINVKELEFK